jgi:hypothetical protein
MIHAPGHLANFLERRKPYPELVFGDSQEHGGFNVNPPVNYSRDGLMLENLTGPPPALTTTDFKLFLPLRMGPDVDGYLDTARLDAFYKLEEGLRFLVDMPGVVLARNNEVDR